MTVVEKYGKPIVRRVDMVPRKPWGVMRPSYRRSFHYRTFDEALWQALEMATKANFMMLSTADVFDSDLQQVVSCGL